MDRSAGRDANDRTHLPLPIRSRAWFHGPLPCAMALFACARPDLLFGVLRASVPDSRSDWAARHPPRRRIPAGGKAVGCSAILVRTYPAVVFGKRRYVDDVVLGGSDRVGASGRQPLAAHDAVGMFPLFCLVRWRGAGLLRLPVGRNAAGGGISFAVSCAGRVLAPVWTKAARGAGGDVPVVVGVVPDLL